MGEGSGVVWGGCEWEEDDGVRVRGVYEGGSEEIIVEVLPLIVLRGLECRFTGELWRSYPERPDSYTSIQYLPPHYLLNKL